MLHTLKNNETVTTILKQIVEKSYDDLKDEEVLLCLECCDVDLEVVVNNHYELEEAIKVNLELDSFGDAIDHQRYLQLMSKLNDFFIEWHIESGLFDYFPEGEYEVNGQLRESDTEKIAPKGIFFAPFEDALIRGNRSEESRK